MPGVPQQYGSSPLITCLPVVCRGSASDGDLAYIVNLPDPSGAKILGLFDGNTNKENAINMAAVASRT